MITTKESLNTFIQSFTGVEANYCEDLNAVAKAEQALTAAERVVYIETLCAILDGNVVDWCYSPADTMVDWESLSLIVFATAPQKAIAFVITKSGLTIKSITKNSDYNI